MWSPRPVYLGRVSQRGGGAGIKFLATLSPPTQRIYIFIFYLYYCSPRKKIKIKRFLAESFAFSGRRKPSSQGYTWCKAPLEYSSHPTSSTQRLSSEKEPQYPPPHRGKKYGDASTSKAGFNLEFPMDWVTGVLICSKKFFLYFLRIVLY